MKQSSRIFLSKRKNLDAFFKNPNNVYIWKSVDNDNLFSIMFQKEYCHWSWLPTKDYIHNPARSWKINGTVARNFFITYIKKTSYRSKRQLYEYAVYDF